MSGMERGWILSAGALLNSLAAVGKVDGQEHYGQRLSDGAASGWRGIQQYEESSRQENSPKLSDWVNSSSRVQKQGLQKKNKGKLQ